MHRRGSNPHLGEMVQFFLPWDCHRSLQTVKKRSGRCGIDLLRLAVQHRFFCPGLYHNLVYDRKRAQYRTDLRVSHAFRDELSDLAWEDGLDRSYWMAALMIRFFEVTDRAAVIRILKTGSDLVYQMMEPTYAEQTGPDRPWYAPLRGTTQRAHRRRRHVGSSPSLGVDDAVYGWLDFDAVRDDAAAWAGR